MKVYFSPAYVMAATEFDTTRKAGWVADSHGWPVAFYIAGGYLGDDVDQRQLVDLHRKTILAAVG